MSIQDFYKSEKWRKFRQHLISERMVNGVNLCEHCGKPILSSEDIHAHHIKELTEENVSDALVSLNPENVMLVHRKCHNEIHSRFCGAIQHKVFVIYGCYCSGKEEYVKQIAKQNDLIISLDKLYEALSTAPKYTNKKGFSQIVFKLRDVLLDCIRTRTGGWGNAYIIEALPLKAKREQMCRVFRATPIYIEATKDQCKQRRKDEGRPSVIDDYIDEWFDDFTE